MTFIKGSHARTTEYMNSRILKKPKSLRNDSGNIIVASELNKEGIRKNEKENYVPFSVERTL